MYFVEQVLSINSFYSGMVVKMAGVYDDTVTIWLSTIPTLINFLGTFVGFYLVERIGRRLLLLTSTAGEAFLLVFFQVFWERTTNCPNLILFSIITEINFITSHILHVCFQATSNGLFQGHRK